jgi:hypothetical protein
MAKKWTGDEIEALRQIRASGKTVKNQLHLLPDRSFLAVRFAVAKVEETRKKRGQMSWVWPNIVHALEKNPGLTASEIQARLGTGYRQIIDLLVERNQQEDKEVYVSSWKRARTLYVQQWSLGDFEDAVKPSRLTVEEVRARKRRRYHEKKGKSRNPFDAAAGLISPPQAPTGRVYTQSMSIREDEEESV